MTYRVAICDDSGPDRAYIENLLQTWAGDRHVSVKTEQFGSAEQFWFRYAEDKAWDILLLDIQMGTIDGVTLAQRIRRENGGVQIVFITGFPEYMAQGYEVSALHYLMKPVAKKSLFSVLDRAADACKRREDALILPVEDGVLRLPVSRIRYVEAFAHQVTVTTRDATLRVKLPISKMEAMLPGDFVRCHRSYLVSLKDIARLTKTQLFLDDGTALPLARSAAPGVYQAFVAYYTGVENETV